ncbi:hypothetical protein NQZ79_g1613 [Umbelopsis isabellina]|nr:hypothetical protein NQZ79_g1613 [Umbelopsis isabellina]
MKITRNKLPLLAIPLFFRVLAEPSSYGAADIVVTVIKLFESIKLIQVPHHRCLFKLPCNDSSRTICLYVNRRHPPFYLAPSKYLQVLNSVYLLNDYGHQNLPLSRASPIAPALIEKHHAVPLPRFCAAVYTITAPVLSPSPERCCSFCTNAEREKILACFVTVKRSYITSRGPTRLRVHEKSSESTLSSTISIRSPRR